ncbi:MFS transporter [Luteimicrobium sp. DT211]|uniref:MFS transporter n=1 Tax=Luteimicrobium sp. DT211 TaxID=3393412 RepID=UPI003CF666C5
MLDTHAVPPCPAASGLEAGKRATPSAVARRSRRLPDAAAFVLLLSVIVFFLAASSAPTPLYATYQAEWGFTPITTTLVFGVYAVAVLAALLVAGRLSDHVGRRPVLLGAVGLQIGAMLAFTTATGVDGLMLARVVQGIATGAAAGTVGAALLDLSARHGALANAVATPIGTALGALGAGILVQYLPQPTHLVYDVLVGVFALQGLGILLMAETLAAARPGALASLRPRLGAPRAARVTLLGVVPALLAGWSLAGLYGALGPSLVRLLEPSAGVVAGGASLFALAGSGALSVYLVRSVPARTVLLLAMPTLAVGLGITLAALSAGSLALFFVGTVVAGLGFGASFTGGIRLTVPFAPEHERAGLLSVLYVVAYVAMGLPAVVAGYLVVHGGGLLTTTREYALIAIGLAVVASVVLLVTGRSRGARTVRA